MKRSYLPLVVIIALYFGFSTAAVAQEKVDSAAVAQIKDEGMNRSQVMEILSYLTDVYGPRLTWSPEYKQAADWAASKMKDIGLQSVHFENWGPLGKGWSLKRFQATVTSPRVIPLIAYPKAWTPGFKGTMKADVVYLEVKDTADFQKYKGQLKGKVVLISNPRELNAHFQPEGVRLADSSLLKLANADIPAAAPRRRWPQISPAMGDSALRAIARQFMPNMDSAAVARMIAEQRIGPRRLQFCQDEGAALVLDVGRGDGGTLFVQSATVPQPPQTPFDQRVGPYSEKAPKIIPQVTVASEHYNRMIRMLQKGQKLSMEVDLQAEFTPADSGMNIVGEIPGTDLKDEIVMVGAHFDSWHGGTGATDNGTGSSVCLEALRIIQKLGLKPRRTIRVGLWGGEEEGLLGSRGYVS
ncbi:MAG: M28 family peptidase, partial [Bacteroidota bacterium]